MQAPELPKRTVIGRTEMDASLAQHAGHAQSELTLGAPRFIEQRLQQIASQQGLGAAWREALTQGAERAATCAEGEFAVGLTDESGAGFLAVDRFAIRTICYRVIDGRLHFAERADELAALPPRAALVPQALFDYSYFHVIPSPRTVFEGVYRLPPAHYAQFENGKLQVAPYWMPRFDEPGVADFTQLAASFREALRNAVLAQLDGSKAACFLSGGTDSSTIAGLIRDVTGGPVSSYSIGFDATGYDEMAYARLAAARFGTDHHEYYVTPADLEQHIPAVAAHYDQPFGNSSALPAYCCARFAHQDGVSRMLAGDGGDELYGGNVRYAKQRVFSWYSMLPKPLRIGLLEPVLERSRLGALPLASKGRSYIEQAKVPLPDRLQMYNLLLRLGVVGTFEAGFLSTVDCDEPLRHQRHAWQAVHDSPSALNRMLAYDWRYTLAESDLPKVRGSANLAGVSVGFPMLDPALVELSLRLPLQYKLKGVKLRWFFKEALRGFLPDEIIAKSKHGFGLPFGSWALQHEGLRRLVTDSLGSLATRRLFRPAFVDQLLNIRLPEHPGYYGEMVWIMVMLEHWLRVHSPNWRSPQ
jgi:asparagine synthase (glutamine-hydrolysing)